MTPEQLKARTKGFAPEIITLVSRLPRTLVAEIIARQIVRLRANYRVACRGRSRAEFAAKVAIVLEKADESLYWLEILHDSSVFAEKSIHGLMREAGELIAIFAASHKTARA
jgi:four helix bundle protein